jgi:hypothetical protein
MLQLWVKFYMKVIVFNNNVEVLTQGVLRSLNDGTKFIKLEVECTEVQGHVLIMLTGFLMLTIASARHYADLAYAEVGEVDAIEDFIYCLGHSQLYAYLKLQSHISPVEGA